MSVTAWKYDPNATVEVDVAGLNELLKGWIEKWQKILRLQDWDITYCITRLYDMTEGAQATVSVSMEKQQAHVKVLDPRDYDPSFVTKQDIEASIVHELMHIPLMMLKRLQGSAAAGDGALGEEMAVNTLTRALVYLDRRPSDTPLKLVEMGAATVLTC